MITIRKYMVQDTVSAMSIWNEVVRDGIAFPQDEELTEQSADSFFNSQSYTGVATNSHALHLYERLGFTQLGRIPQGFRMKDGHYEDIIPHYILLK